MSSKKFRFPSRAEILAFEDLKFEDVDVPEWGDDVRVRVRTLKAHERDWFEASTFTRNGKNVTANLQNIRARLCLLCMIDPETNETIFQPEDEFPLGGKSAAALDRIFGVAQRLNGLRNEDVQELAKNSNADLQEDSLSD